MRHPVPKRLGLINFRRRKSSTGSCWIDAATGTKPYMVPIGIYPQELTRLQEGAGDINHAAGGSGHTYVRQPDGSWIDAGSGAAPPTIPIGIYPQELTRLQEGAGDINHAAGGSGHTYVRIPCPPSSAQASPPTVPLLPNFGIGIGVGPGREDRR
jgi:hypothetical protein